MSSDKLGLQWHKDDSKVPIEDNSLYTVMIWALIIGIIIVITTLFLTRPAPENFTELYFNNHTTLPEYSKVNNTETFSFTINNLEHRSVDYNYTISTEFYSLDYSCTRPDIYLETVNQSRYTDFLTQYSTLQTRATQTNKPELIIKNTQYVVSFNYRLLSGNQIVFALVDVNDTPKYSLIINHDSNEVYFISPDRGQKAILKLKYDSVHYFKLNMTQNNAVLSIDDQMVTFKTPKNYTRGFPYIETTSTYADVYNMIIQRADSQQNVVPRIADSKSEDIILNTEATPNMLIVYSKYLSGNQALYDKLFIQPIVQTQTLQNSLTQYYSNKSINITDNDITVSFRATKFLVSLSDLKIYYNATNIVHPTLTIIKDNIAQTFNVNSTSRYQDLTLSILDNTAEISFNGVYIANITRITTENVMPYIETYESTASIREFSIKNNFAPITYTLKIKEIAPQQSYAGLYSQKIFQQIAAPIIWNSTTDNITGMPNNQTQYTDEQLQRIQAFIDQQKLGWRDYRVVVYYTDITRNDTFSLSFDDFNQTLYSIDIASKNNSVIIKYLNNSQLKTVVKNVSITSLTRLFIDIENNTLSMTLNDKLIFKSVPDRSTNGILLMDYQNINLLNAQVENINTGEVKVYKKQTYVDCSPKIIKTVQYNGNETIHYGESKIFDSYVKLQEPFDIAKISVNIAYYQQMPVDKTLKDTFTLQQRYNQTLNDKQEIYFIVKDI